MREITSHHLAVKDGLVFYPFAVGQSAFNTFLGPMLIFIDEEVLLHQLAGLLTETTGLALVRLRELLANTHNASQVNHGVFKVLFNSLKDIIK